jgi:hypothetical protein
LIKFCDEVFMVFLTVICLDYLDLDLFFSLVCV